MAGSGNRTNERAAERTPLEAARERVERTRQVYAHDGSQAGRDAYLTAVAATAIDHALLAERDTLADALREIAHYEEPWPQDPSDVYEEFQSIARRALAELSRG